MKLVGIFLLIVHIVYSQFNMTVFTKLPNVTFTGGLVFGAIRQGATKTYASVKESGTAKIIKWNVTSATNVTREAQYIYPSTQYYIYSYVYFFKGYILACANSYPPRLFNESTNSYIGSLSLNLTFGRGEYISSKNVFFFGSNTGQVGYFSLDNFPDVTVSPVYLHNDSISNFVFLEKSYDENYVSVSFLLNTSVLIYRVSDWQLNKTLTVYSAGVYTQSWSSDSRYIMVFMYNENFVYVYDRDSSWALVKNQTIGHKNIRTNFYYEQTNIVVALSQMSNAVIIINWYDYTSSSVYSIDGWKMYSSDTGQSMTIFQTSSNTAWFFNINPYCTNNTYYNQPTKTCISCESHCTKCSSTTSCSICASNYTLLANGSCQACAAGTAYNATTLLCDSCSANCSVCTSASICTTCLSSANLVNSSCDTCPVGNIYNYTLWTCQANCTTNCATCASNSTCSVCASSYNLMPTGLCQTCPNQTFYNSTSKACQSCASNCLTCNSGTVCTDCLSGASLYNGSCIVCPIGNSFNSTSQSCEVSCTSNCATCDTATTCSVCSPSYNLMSTGLCQTCPNQTFYNSTSKTCQSCASDCFTCTSGTLCTACSSSTFLFNDSCIVCPTGNTFNYTSQICQPNCRANCATCASSTTCSICASSYNFMSTGECSQCPSSTFYDSTSQTCESCPSNCSICTSSASCSSCVNSTFLFNNSCVACSVGSIFNYTSQNCEPNCTDNCQICDSQTECLTCDSGFSKSLTGLCILCISNCNKCQNQTSCDECGSGFQLSNGACVVHNDDSDSDQDEEEDENENEQDDVDGKRRGKTLYDITMGLTVESDVVGILNKVPGSRRIMRQLFSFFLNIDHLWLYIYHKREYGYYVDRLLKAVQNLQQQKWNMVSEQIFKKTLNLDMNVVSDRLNFKINSTSWKYIEVENQSSSFLENSLDYFFLNVPLVVGMFFLFRFLFYLLFKFEISLLFREYAFNGYLLLMLVQGNCESFTYLFMYDSAQITSTNFSEKMLNLLTLLLFVIFIAQLISGFFLLKSSYDKNAKYFYDNCSNTLTGSTQLLIEYGLLNFCLGAAHLMVENYYNTQLLVLFWVQVVFITVIVSSINKSKLYEYKYIEWQNILASFLRICLIITYYFDQNFPGEWDPSEQTQMYLIIIYLFNWIFSAMIAYYLVLNNLFKFIYKNIIAKKSISTIHLNPYLERYQNLARREVNKQKVKIEAIQQQIQLDQTGQRFKLELMVSDDINGSISIVQKIKLYKNPRRDIGEEQTNKQRPRTYNKDRFKGNNKEGNKTSVKNTKFLKANRTRDLTVNNTKSRDEQQIQIEIEEDYPKISKTATGLNRKQSFFNQQSIIKRKNIFQRKQTENIFHKSGLNPAENKENLKKQIISTQFEGVNRKLRFKEIRNRIKNGATNRNLESMQIQINKNIY